MIPIFRPSYDDREVEALRSVLNSKWVGLGPKTEEFEEKFAHYVGAKYAVGLNSCTAALHLVLKLLDVGPGDEVLVPTLTFVSTAHAVVYCGAKPVFVDVQESDLCIGWWDASTKVTDRTKAIIPVLYGGVPLSNMVESSRLKYIWDCAHACGSNFNAAGRLCCWSFHAVKNLATGDGGMLTTDNKDQYERAKRLRWMGINKSTHERETGGYNWEYNVEEIGFKYHMNDIIAAIGLVQLEKMPHLQIKRSYLAGHYVGTLYKLGLQEKITIPNNIDSSWHLFVIRTPRRDELALYLRSKDIATGVHYKPIHLYECYGPQPSLPVAERVWKELLTLPLYPDLTTDEVKMICGHIGDFFKCSN